MNVLRALFKGFTPWIVEHIPERVLHVLLLLVAALTFSEAVVDYTIHIR